MAPRALSGAGSARNGCQSEERGCAIGTRARRADGEPRWPAEDDDGQAGACAGRGARRRSPELAGDGGGPAERGGEADEHAQSRDPHDPLAEESPLLAGISGASVAGRFAIGALPALARGGNLGMNQRDALATISPVYREVAVKCENTRLRIELREANQTGIGE